MEGSVPSVSSQIAPPDYVRMTVDTGVSPLEMRFSQINSARTKEPVALLSHTFVNSVLTGVLSPEQYVFAADEASVSSRLFAWNLRRAAQTVLDCEDNGLEVSFVTARCSSRVAASEDMFELVKSILSEANFSSPEKLCVEFPVSLLYEDVEKARVSLLNLKLLNVRSLISGVGGPDCPLTSLIDLPADMVLLSPGVTSMAGTRAKGAAFLSIVSFLRSLPVEVISDGVFNDIQITVLGRSDCYGYVPSSGYRGNVSHGSLRMTPAEIPAVFRMTGNK